MSESQFFNEFTDIKKPSFLINNNWRDESWHNDLAPRMTFTGFIGHDVFLDVWVFDNSYSEMGIKKHYYVALCEHGVIDEESSQECKNKKEVKEAVTKLLESKGIKVPEKLFN